MGAEDEAPCATAGREAADERSGNPHQGAEQHEF
jgi:hypothetical protein